MWLPHSWSEQKWCLFLLHFHSLHYFLMCRIPTETPFKSEPILGESTGLFLVFISSRLFLVGRGGSWICWTCILPETFCSSTSLNFLVFSSSTHPLPLEFLFFLFALSKHESWAVFNGLLHTCPLRGYLYTFLPWLFTCIQYIKQFCKYLLYTYLVIYSLIREFLLCARQCPHTGNSKKKVSIHPKTHFWSRGRSGECHERRHPGAIKTEGGSDPAWRLEKASQRRWHLMWTPKRE